MSDKLFVYGTLGPGRPNAHVLENIGGTWENASVTGVLHQEGWGAEMGFPAITLDSNGQRVDGFLFSSDHLKDHWQFLDEFEGDAYERIIAQVETESSSMVEAYIYSLKR